MPDWRPATMSTSISSNGPRVTLDGKFFRLGGKKFHVKGVAYGPFAPDPSGLPFASRERTSGDFALLRELGANLIRVYAVPPKWFLDLAFEFDLKVLVDVPWAKHVCFLDSEEAVRGAIEAVRHAAYECAGHPAVFALSVVNEIPADIVRWSGAKAVGDFIDELVDVVKQVDPDQLCTFANFPPTEFLQAGNVDFICFNVYLHQARAFENYMARLQMLADSKPLLLGEFGMDSLHEGEAAQAGFLSWQIEAAFRGGAAGVVAFSFTDDWHKDGRQIEDWAFGLTTRDRRPKPAFHAVRGVLAQAPYFPPGHWPKVSVVVASYNGGRTLEACLASLQRLNYPDYEVILVDDGSTDDTPQVAARHPQVRCLRHEKNRGLSAARNTGIAASTGEIVAFTDSDCRADEDWLHYLIADLLNSRFAGIGGHNFLPPDDSIVAAAVMVSPGGPAHVMLTDRVAEHIPGCNMAFYKWALEEIGGFDPIFRKAGDDVDICWRLQERGYTIGFSPAGFVWHYRRSNLKAYLDQQRGYGESEALLVRKHPEYFSPFGGGIWRGRIYSPAKMGLVTRRPVIYHGVFGSGFFQSIYREHPSVALMMLTSLEYHVLVTLPLLVLGVVFEDLRPLGIASALASLALCGASSFQAVLPRKKKRLWSRPLVALLFFLQPIVRGLARHQEGLSLRQMPLAAHETLDTLDAKHKGKSFHQLEYWADQPLERVEFLKRVIEELDRQGWRNKSDVGWSDFDIEVFGSRWCRLRLTAIAEAHGGGRQLFRCRLLTDWSLLAHVVFWSALSFELLIIGVLPSHMWWVSGILISMVGLVLLLRQEQRNLRRIIAVFLDDLAGRIGLAKIGGAPPKPAEAAAPAPVTTQVAAAAPTTKS
jgi:glycosyltransferase involved in cell wall biosynthesis